MFVIDEFFSNASVLRQAFGGFGLLKESVT